MDPEIQALLDAMTEMAKTSGVEPTPPEILRSMHENNSLLKILRTPKDAEHFMADLEAMRLLSQKK